jgi:hypothetical protein
MTTTGVSGPHESLRNAVAMFLLLLRPGVLADQFGAAPYVSANSLPRGDVVPGRERLGKRDPLLDQLARDLSPY